MAEELTYCAAEVRRWDYDRFLTVLFAPAAAREKLFALYAFNHEIAKVRESVSEPMLGQIRLQWWREAIAGLYEGRIRKHPVVEALAPAVAAASGARAGFEKLIDAREFDLAGRAPATAAELEAYCEGTSAQLLWLAAIVLGADRAAAQGALRHVGVAWALTGLIRAIPFHARARRRFVPADVAEAAGLDEDALFSLRPGAALRAAAGKMAALAEAHLAQARRDEAAEPRTRPLMLLGTLAGAYLRLLRRRGYAVMERPIELAPAAKIARLWWGARTGRI